MNEILLIDKPADWTSFDVVAKIRSIYSEREGKKVKVGHAGTLDPFATGLLIILVGEATKKQINFMKLDKEYLATLKLGYVSTSGDPEGEIKKKEGGKEITKEEIEKVLPSFTGEITQTPPAFSAIKINGKRAYELARKGKKVKLKPRKVKIDTIEITDYSWPVLKLKVACSSGTYIRSLAGDIGKKLGCGAYLTGLTRTKIGEYSLDNAQKITDLST